MFSVCQRRATAAEHHLRVEHIEWQKQCCSSAYATQRQKRQNAIEDTVIFWPLEVVLGLEIGPRLFWFKQRSRLFVGSALADWLLAFHELP